MKHTKLLEPITIRNLTLENRMVIPAMLTRYSEEDGGVNERLMAYYEARARGGWGLHITENLAVRSDGKASKRVIGAWDDSQVAGLAELVRRVHQAGGKIAGQIYHAGRATSTLFTGLPIVAPSPLQDPTIPQMPQALTTEQVGELVEQFAAAARRVKAAGFDAVEIHGGHGYLVSAFLSPYSNKRTDRYGGSLRRRASFALEIVDAVRGAVGDFPILFRFSAKEYVNGGLDLAETRVIARLLEEAGVDCLNVSHAVYKTMHNQFASFNVPKANYIENAAAIKAVVNIPVITVGRINDPDVAEAVLQSGAADLVAMARASLADPELPNKVKAGDLEDIRKCIGCLQGCQASPDHVHCLVNPETSREQQYHITPAAKPETVFVAGGGIAGCEAARVAALRGHRVTLFEQGGELGGQWIAAAMPVNKSEHISLVLWLRGQLEKLGVEVRLNTALTADTVRTEAPAAVIVATGSEAAKPPIPGIDRPEVAMAQDVLLGKARFGKQIVVIGGGMVGAETADHLAEHNMQVSIVEKLPEVAADEHPICRRYLMGRLVENKVAMHTNATVEKIDDAGVTVNTPTGKITIPADTVVIATGSRSRTALADQLADCGCKVTAVGDANKVGHGMDAMAQGYAAGFVV